jgi:nucleoside-diphosphate-sugar epimerase
MNIGTKTKEHFVDKAIITGASGLVGTSVAKHLSSYGVQLLCLGRKDFSTEECHKYFGQQSKYISLSMRNISTLPEILKKIGWSSFEGALFYNFAWSGKSSLADGAFSDQLQNAVWSAEAVKVAKAIGCSKFINSGSMEETFIETFGKMKIKQEYKSAQTNYGLAKLATRDMSRMIAYIEGIDYVHTRMSVPLDSCLSKGTYISSIMKKILKGEEYEKPQSTSLYDLVILEDVAIAYQLIGEKGLNKADYYIGTGRPATLQRHFERFTQIIGGQNDDESDSIENENTRLFDVQRIRQETGFVAALGLQDISIKALNK